MYLFLKRLVYFLKPLALLRDRIPKKCQRRGQVGIALVLGLDQDLKCRDDCIQPDPHLLDIVAHFPGHDRASPARRFDLDCGGVVVGFRDLDVASVTGPETVFYCDSVRTICFRNRFVGVFFNASCTDNSGLLVNIFGSGAWNGASNFSFVANLDDHAGAVPDNYNILIFTPDGFTTVHSAAGDLVSGDIVNTRLLGP